MSAPARPPWEFGYAPVTPAAREEEPTSELVVASREAIDRARIARAIGGGAEASSMIARAPLFWTRVALSAPALASSIAARIEAAGIAARYVAPADRASLAIGARLEVRREHVARADAWKPRERGARAGRSGADGMWFLRAGEGGVAVDRACCGRGAGTRLAVIDDDALEAHALELDAEVGIGVEHAPRNSTHGALMVAWASGARGFEGVAPGASRRLYLIPKPGRSVAALPLAIARAVLDGADVIVCATYVEGSTSPMLDDALEIAARAGRRGRGAAVVLPTGRETSSVAGSMHASFSLGLGEPASDPRVICVAPGARGEGWFLWRDRRGRLRPFANRGPAVRWLAPGDDIAYPFSPPGAPARLFHAESSGASAIAAGVLLLVIGVSPSLRLVEALAAIEAGLARVPSELDVDARALADPADLLPRARDADGHDAKHGDGRVDATRACLVAADPVSAALIAMGEDAAARAHVRAASVASRRLRRWAARALLVDREASRALRVILRHLRLVGRDEARRRAHGEGAIIRHLQLFLRRLALSSIARPRSVHAEIEAMERRLAEVAGDAARASRFERDLAERAASLFERGPA